MFLFSSCSCVCKIYWSQALSREWRCSRSSADRRCSNYIWVINNVIAYYHESYIRGMSVSQSCTNQGISWRGNKHLQFSIVDCWWESQRQRRKFIWKSSQIQLSSHNFTKILTRSCRFRDKSQQCITIKTELRQVVIWNKIRQDFRKGFSANMTSELTIITNICKFNNKLLDTLNNPSCDCVLNWKYLYSRMKQMQVCKAIIDLWNTVLLLQWQVVWSNINAYMHQ